MRHIPRAAGDEIFIFYLVHVHRLFRANGERAPVGSVCFGRVVSLALSEWLLKRNFSFALIHYPSVWGNWRQTCQCCDCRGWMITDLMHFLYGQTFLI